MKKGMFLSIIMGLLLFLPLVANAELINNEPKTITSSYDENVPIWTEGDYWTYNIDYSANYESLFEFDWHFNNIQISVNEVTTSTYKMKINGEVTGTISAGIITGSLFSS